jgi:hypothetical protein
MDSNDEFMIQALMEEKANDATEEDEHLRIVSCLLRLKGS